MRAAHTRTDARRRTPGRAGTDARIRTPGRAGTPGRSRTGVPIAAAFVLLLFVGAGTAAQTPPGRYRSNEIGMALERLPNGEEAGYVLEVRERDAGFERVLLHEDEVQTRVFTEYSVGRPVSETEWRDGQRIEQREFDREGRLIGRTQFEGDQARTRSEFEYAEDRLVMRVDSDAEGNEIAREEYWYRQDGFLRRVERRFEGGGRGRSEFLYSGGTLVEEWHERGEAVVLVRYDSYGRLELTEERHGGEVVVVERRVYEERGEAALLDTSPALVEVERPSEQVRTVTEYGDERRPVREQRWESGELVVETRYEYSAGRLSRELIEREGRIEERVYEYDDEGGLVEEERFVENTLTRRFLYREDTRIEERYVNGELALIVEFDGEQRVREQVVRDGEVVREREF